MEQNAEASIDPAQQLYLRYISALTGRSLPSLIHEIVEQWLDVSYSSYAQSIELKRGLLPTIANPNDPEALFAAYDNMVKNLALLENQKLDNARSKPLGKVIPFKSAPAV